jgi:phosphoglycerate dehydrogenase-like enzyme
VGIDNVDLQAATEVGCLVVNAPTANTVAAAEHGIALLTALARNVAPASASKDHTYLWIFTSPYSQLFQEINKYNSS